MASCHRCTQSRLRSRRDGFVISGRIGLEISIELHTQCVERRRDEAVLSYREDDIHELLSSVTLRQRRPCGIIKHGAAVELVSRSE